MTVLDHISPASLSSDMKWIKAQHGICKAAASFEDYTLLWTTTIGLSWRVEALVSNAYCKTQELIKEVR